MHTLVGFGASTMQGAGDSQGGFFKRLEQQWPADFPPTRLVNHGRGGNSTRDMLARTADLAALRPYDLIVLLGCNDVPRARDPWPGNRATLEEYTANLDRLFGLIKGRHSLFISSFAVSAPLTGVDPVTFDAYLTRALALAQKHGFEICDLYRHTQATAAGYWAPDGLHFGDAGHQFIAEQVLGHLRAKPPHPEPRSGGSQ